MQDINSLISKIASAYGMDPNLVRAIVQIESGGNPSAGTGSYKGLMQLSSDEFSKYGGDGSIFNPEQNLKAGVASLADKAGRFQSQYGRSPTPTELYLMHQQGEGGLRSQISNPDAPAWKNMYSTAEGQAKGPGWAKQAIWGNIPDSAKSQFGSVDNVTGKDFVSLWDQRLNRGLGTQVAQNVPLPPDKPQALSIWDNPQSVKVAPYQVAQEQPHSIWDAVPNAIKGGGITTASAAEAPPMQFADNAKSLYDSLGPKDQPLLQAGGVTPAQAALPPSNNPMSGTSFADRFNPPAAQSPNNYAPSSIFGTNQPPADPFSQTMQGASGLQPWQVAGADVYKNPLGTPLMLPQVNVSPAPPLPPPSPISRPAAISQPGGNMPPQTAPMMPPVRPSNDIFAQNVYGTNPTMGPYTTPQDFNLQEQAMKTGYAPWAPQFGGQPQPISPTNPLAASASPQGLLGQMQAPGGLLGKLLSSLNNTPMAASSNPANSLSLSNSFNTNVPSSGLDQIKAEAQANSMDPTMAQNNGLLGNLFSQLQMGSGSMLDNLFGGQSTLPMMDMGMPDMGIGDFASMSPGSFDFGFVG